MSEEEKEKQRTRSKVEDFVAEMGVCMCYVGVCYVGVGVPWSADTWTNNKRQSSLVLKT